MPNDKDKIKTVRYIRVNSDWKTAFVKFSDGSQNDRLAFSEMVRFNSGVTSVGDYVKQKQSEREKDARETLMRMAISAEQSKTPKKSDNMFFSEYLSPDFIEKLKRDTFGKYKITTFTLNSGGTHANMEMELWDKTAFIDKDKIIKQGVEKVNKDLEQEYKSSVSSSGENYVDLTPLKAYLHYKFGGGKPLYVDISSLNFSFLTLDDFFTNGKFEKQKSINLFDKLKWSIPSITLGEVRIEYIGNDKIKIQENTSNGKRYNDVYDFNIRWKEGATARNIATAIAGVLHNLPVPLLLPDLKAQIINAVATSGGNPYNIYFRGEVKIGKLIIAKRNVHFFKTECTL